jgi:isochorismate synthase
VTVNRGSVSKFADGLEAAFAVCSQSSARLAAVTVPIPVVNPSHVFAQFDEEPAHYFSKEDSGGDVGLGAVATLEAAQLDELSTLEAEAQQLLEHPFEVGIGAAARSPRLYGGIAYDRAPDPAGPWRAFARIRFDLPRFRYLSDGRLASLTIHLLPKELALASERQDWLARVLELEARLTSPPGRQHEVTIRERTDRPNAELWKRNVELALVAIRRAALGSQKLEKVVLAREIELELDSTPDIASLVENINLLSPGTTRFAFRRNRCVFLGATPERLVLRLGSELRTEAVAGSIRALDADAASHLMQNEKERHEHELVVHELVRKLKALGARPDVPSRPSIRQLRHVLHLATPLTARLFGPPHILTLVSNLHPTPAVGGVPEAAAAQFIRRHEGFDRGWYAAPIGWFDAVGDGEFVVGIRSGLLERNTLRLYAGAGIVKDSDPEKEFHETELKLMSLLDALRPGRDGVQPSASKHPMPVSEGSDRDGL